MSLLTIKEFYDMRIGAQKDEHVILLDGDWLVYTAMASAEEEVDWGDDQWVLTCDHAVAKERLESAIQRYITTTDPFEIATKVIAYSSSTNWRKRLVEPTYKDNRKGSRKPLGYKEFLKKLWEDTRFIHVHEEMLEGDDVMGVIGSGCSMFKYKKATLISCDKDFKTIPNVDFLWCRPTAVDELLEEQTYSTADWHHMFQTIKGDVTDGYSGIPGCGEKAASDFLHGPYIVEQKNTKWVRRKLRDGETQWDGIKSLAEKAGMSEEGLIKQAQLARILRIEDYDFTQGKIHQWNPR